MSWRTVIVTGRAKLDKKLGFMVVRSEENIKRVLLDEVSVLIIENCAVSITASLINELANRKVKLIFCDEKHNPSCEMLPLYGCHNCTARVREQVKWDEDVKAYIWTSIVSEKIRNQARVLQEFGHEKEAGMLKGYIDEIELGDETNREGHAAKVYFNALFGKEFSRNADNAINSALNYGYSIILSAFNREITSNGYITQLGLFHDNMFNNFNLASDLMEPFRTLIDRFVREKNYRIFNSEQKREIIGILNESVIINNTEQYVTNAVKIYCRSVFDAIEENDVSLIRFYRVRDLKAEIK